CALHPASCAFFWCCSRPGLFARIRQGYSKGHSQSAGEEGGHAPAFVCRGSTAIRSERATRPLHRRRVDVVLPYLYRGGKGLLEDAEYRRFSHHRLVPRERME